MLQQLFPYVSGKVDNRHILFDRITKMDRQNSEHRMLKPFLSKYRITNVQTKLGLNHDLKRTKFCSKTSYKQGFNQ